MCFKECEFGVNKESVLFVSLAGTFLGLSVAAAATTTSDT